MNLTKMTIEEIELLKPSVFYTRVPHLENFILVPMKIMGNNEIAQWNFNDDRFFEEDTDTFEDVKKVLKELPDNYYFYVEDSPC